MKKTMWYKKWAAFTLVATMGISTLPLCIYGAESDIKDEATEEIEEKKDQLMLEVTGEISIKSETDDRGEVSTVVKEENVLKAISKAESSLRKEEKRLRKENKRKYENTEFVVGNVHVVFVISEGKEETKAISVEVPKETWKALTQNGVESASFKLGKVGPMITLSQEAIRELSGRTDEYGYIEMHKAEKERFSPEASMVMGEYPAYEIYFQSEEGRVRSLEKGSLTVTLPYTLQAREFAEDVQGVLLNEDAMFNFAKRKWYDKEKGLLTFQTTEFCTYSVYAFQPKEGVIDNTDLGTGFLDIINHKDKVAISYVHENKLMSGVSDMAFAPNAPITRGMLVTVLGRAAKIKTADYKNAGFKDVKKTEYYAPYIAWALQSGIASGTDAGVFSPERAVSRQELAVMLANYAKFMEKTLEQRDGKILFDDEKFIAPWAKEKVIAVQRAGMMKAKSGNLFDPKGIASRADVAVALYQFEK